MKKDTVPVAVGALILGFVLGIAFPKLFPDKTQQVAHSPDDGHDHSQQQQQQQPAEITDEQVDHALMQYEKMLEKDPNNKDIYISMGNLCYDASRYQQAIDYYEKGLQLDPDQTDARVDMATMYRKLGQPEKAVQTIQEAISRDPSHPLARLNLGIILRFDLHDYHLATKALQDFLKVAPNHPQAKLAKKFIEEMAPQLRTEAEKPAS